MNFKDQRKLESLYEFLKLTPSEEGPKTKSRIVRSADLPNINDIATELTGEGLHNGILMSDEQVQKVFDLIDSKKK